ncbi:hypothetical protein ACJJH9_04395 [Microbulbifer sp. DLAB2-AF]|uniref:hypothetical protein n=1 Tax=Microbulbifer sp. DLAB2-AF TaxID=3243395 RepID=UPI0040396C6F
MEWDIEKPGLRGNVYVSELEAGEYEIYSWQSNSGMASFWSSNNFSTKFTVEPGKPIYLGAFHFQRRSGFGATILNMDVLYRNMAERDLEIAKSKFHYINVDEIDYVSEISQSEEGETLTVWVQKD